MKKITGLIIISLFLCSISLADDLIVIDELQGLVRNPTADKIPNGAHTRFENLYIKDGNINVVKGRDRLNSTALSNTTINGLTFIDSVSGTVTVNSNTDLLLHFDETNGSTTTSDSGDNSIAITLNNGAVIDSTGTDPGSPPLSTFNNQLSLDGVDDFAQTALGSDLKIRTNDFTISFWVFFDVLPPAGGARLVDSSDVRITTTDVAWTFSVTSGSECFISFSQVITTSTWINVVVSRVEDISYLILDGVVERVTEGCTTDIDKGVAEVKYSFGANSAGAKPLDGRMDEIRIIIGRGQEARDFSVAVNRPFIGPFTSKSITTTSASNRLVIVEDTFIRERDTSGTLINTLVSGLTSETWDFAQAGGSLYMTSTTNGIHKWTGDTTAIKLTPVSGTTTDFFADGLELFNTLTGESSSVPGDPDDEVNIAGGLTPGLDLQLACDSGSTTNLTASFTPDPDGDCSGGGFICQRPTNALYRYKLVQLNNNFGIESNPTSLAQISLQGAGDFQADCDATEDDIIIITGEQTGTETRLGDPPTFPFDTFRLYRTVSGGKDFFLTLEQEGGFVRDRIPDQALQQPLDTTIKTIDIPAFPFIEEYKGHIFVGEKDTIRFTHLPVNTIENQDQYWLETDKILIGGNSDITGLHTTANSLLIFTNQRISELTGFGAGSFQLNTLIEGIGVVSDKTIESDINGDIIFFGGTSGVYKLVSGQQSRNNVTGQPIGRPDIRVNKISFQLDEVFRGDDAEIDLTPSDYTSSHAYYDLDNDLYFLYIDQESFIYDNLNNTWSHIPATKMSDSVYRKVPGSAGQGVIIDDVGFIFNNWTGYENGIESGTVTGNPTGSTNTTLTDSGATFNTTNDGLTGLWVFIDNLNREYRQITSNTGTQLTVSPVWTTNPIISDDYFITYIIPDLLTKTYSLGKPPNKSIVSHFWLVNEKADSAQDVTVFSFEDKRTESTSATEFDLADSFINKFTSPLNNEFIQWGLQSFVYNISNTINTPINIISYAFKGKVEDTK